MAMIYVMCGLPVVEHLIAILDGREGSGDDVGDKEYVERNDGFELRALRRTDSLASSKTPMARNLTLWSWVAERAPLELLRAC